MKNAVAIINAMCEINLEIDYSPAILTVGWIRCFSITLAETAKPALRPNLRNSAAGRCVQESMKLDIGTCKSRTGPRKLRFRIRRGCTSIVGEEFLSVFRRVCLATSFSRDRDTINEFTPFTATNARMFYRQLLK